MSFYFQYYKSSKGLDFIHSIVSLKIVGKSLIFIPSESLLEKSNLVGSTAFPLKVLAFSYQELIFDIHYKYLANVNSYKHHNIGQTHFYFHDKLKIIMLNLLDGSLMQNHLEHLDA